MTTTASKSVSSSKTASGEASPAASAAPDHRLEVQYFNGRSARAIPMQLELKPNRLRLWTPGGALFATRPLTPRAIRLATGCPAPRFELGDGAHVEVIDVPGLQQQLQALGVRTPLIARLQQSWTSALLALAMLAVLIGAVYLWVFPWTVNQLASRAAPRLEAELGERLWPRIDQQWFDSSLIDPERQQRLRQQFTDALRRAGMDESGFTIEFRHSALGPNAFALPGGHIVITDALVRSQDDPAALIGVLAHELGHLRARHALRTLMQRGALQTVLRWLSDDLGQITTTLASHFTTLSYSRDFEREADDFAADLLRKAGLPLAPYAKLLESTPSATSGMPAGWSTHPDAAERVARLMARGG